MKVDEVSVEFIERRIFMVRGRKVMLDADLAKLYGVPTKALNQAVRRNINRFPKDFMFKLTNKEKSEVVTNCDHLQNLKFSSILPKAFSEHGALMLANVLNSQKAIEVSISVVRAFTNLRELLATHKGLMQRLEEIEKKYDLQFRVVFEAIRQLMQGEEKPKGLMGFRVGEAKVRYSATKKKREIGRL